MAQVAGGNLIFTFLSFVSSPIAAHELGPAGRGRLAAVTVPFVWWPVILSVGLPVFAARTAAKADATERGKLVGTLVAASLVLGALGLLIGIFLSPVLAPHDRLVQRLVFVGFCLLPAFLVANVCVGVISGIEAWRLVTALKVTPQAIIVSGYVVLLLLHRFTVEAAAIVVYGGTLLSWLPAIWGAVRGVPLRFDRSLLREGVEFGSRAWIGTLSSWANNRLDQLLMIPLASERQLGLYSVAVTLTGLDALLLSALATVVGPSIARGNHDLVARAVRFTIFTDACFCLACAAGFPLLIPLAFGHAFEASLPMCYVLLASSIPGAAVTVLGPVLQSAGYPGIPAIGEAVALAFTVIGLILLLPPLGGLGAAIVSVVAYGTSFSIQAMAVRRRLGIPIKDLVLFRPNDVKVLLRGRDSSVDA